MEPESDMDQGWAGSIIPDCFSELGRDKQLVCTYKSGGRWIEACEFVDYVGTDLGSLCSCQHDLV